MLSSRHNALQYASKLLSWSADSTLKMDTIFPPETQVPFQHTVHTASHPSNRHYATPQGQHHWASGLCPPSETVNIVEHDVSETGSISVFTCEEGHTYSDGALSNGPNSLPLLTSGRKQVSLTNAVFASYLEYRRMA